MVAAAVSPAYPEANQLKSVPRFFEEERSQLAFPNCREPDSLPSYDQPTSCLSSSWPPTHACTPHLLLLLTTTLLHAQLPPPLFLLLPLLLLLLWRSAWHQPSLRPLHSAAFHQQSQIPASLWIPSGKSLIFAVFFSVCSSFQNSSVRWWRAACTSCTLPSSPPPPPPPHPPSPLCWRFIQGEARGRWSPAAPPPPSALPTHWSTSSQEMW